MWNYPTTVNNSEIYILLPKPCPLMWHLVCGNPVRNGQDNWSKRCQICLSKVALLKIPMDSVQRNTEHCGMHDDMNDEHRFKVKQKPSIGVLCTDSKTCLSWMNTCILIIVHVIVLQRNAYRNLQMCRFCWTSLACLRLSILTISYMISTHKVLH